ncbi:HNH endonuclease [Desulfocurvibacter africanus]|uniref:HNH endonuclease n=1 Tax=Desulfocurvibacter africanus TaxID=873 RepID=UPI00110C3EF5|nr:HNH endonuclease [Desulfocurvibacter africanus]
MVYKSMFRMPTPVNITGRSSSITNAFINSIIPVIQPSEDQIKEALDILGMTPETFQCAYCGNASTEWDHLRPLVMNKRPTGFISEICNLIPSCGKCNQSKGNKEWRTWIYSSAKHSPAKRNINDLEARVKRLEAYEKWGKPIQVDFEVLIGPDYWA